MGFKKGTITKTWTKEEIEFLRENYNKMEYNEIAKILNRTYYSTLEKINNLKLKKRDFWNEEDINFLRENYKDISIKQMAKYLKKTISSISHKLSRLRLTTREKWNKEKVLKELINLSKSRGKIKKRDVPIRLVNATYEYFDGWNNALINAGIEITPEHKGGLGKKYSKEIVEKRRLKMIGHKVSEETSKKIWKTRRKNGTDKGFKSKLKGKNFEEIHGDKKSKEIKIKIKEARAKQIFPTKDTKIELKIQNFLKTLGIEFFTHQYIKDIEHRYQCDILIPSMNVVIECDGDYWHKYPIGNEIDHVRTKELLEKGFKVLRLWEFEINDMTIEQFKERLK